MELSEKQRPPMTEAAVEAEAGAAIAAAMTPIIEAAPTLELFVGETAPRDLFLRRALDVVVSSSILLALIIPMALIALAIKLTSRGPVFYLQNRYGKDGHTFPIWKFRTMCVCEADNEMRQAQDKDPRVTGLGELLRKTSLDELPNFINVLLGHMSLVGPRPHPIRMDDEFAALIYGYNERLRVKPGVTGLAQICGSRGLCDTVELMRERVDLDLYYVRHASLWLDLQIVFKTAMMVMTGRPRCDVSDLSFRPSAYYTSEFIH